MSLIQKHRVGSANEHLVAHALLTRGDTVYWPAVQASHVDLLFFKPKRSRPLLVQVKSAYRYRGGLIVRTHANKYRGLHLDYLGVADRDRRVWLIPWSHLRGRQTLCLGSKHDQWRIDKEKT